MHKIWSKVLPKRSLFSSWSEGKDDNELINFFDMGVSGESSKRAI